MTPIDDASARQIQAANPRASTWLSANAGSGKTRVLTDRVARLLLAGTPPRNVLCLTFTKAAASEMQNRLFKRLGNWAMAPDDDLRAKLAALGITPAPDDAALLRARTLFARAVDTPGGLKIQTIHSFCAAVLRRFPLESGVSPQFAEMDDGQSAELATQVLDDMARGDGLADISALMGRGDLAALTDAVRRNRARFDSPLGRAAALRLFGLADGDTPDSIAASVTGNTAGLAELVQALADGNKTEQTFATSCQTAITSGRFADFTAAFLTGTMTPRARLPAAARRKSHPDLAATYDQFAERVFAAHQKIAAATDLENTLALQAFATTFLRNYDQAKLARGWIDYDDMILRARDLLGRTGVAEWVLYRLDGGIDHILVDEAQDTSPAQWDVIAHLAREITAGAGRSDPGERTLFVVGDHKQSIYSFQGTDPAAFDRMRARFDDALSHSTGLVQLELRHSFRSAPPVLGIVDTALGDLPGLGQTVAHIPFHDRLPGRVDLWPLAQSDDMPEDRPWFDPRDRVLPSAAASLLARAIADTIRTTIDSGTRIPRNDGSSRPVHEGDFLILVRSRERMGLFDLIIADCKRAGLAIAGADRLKLAAELAVRDIKALLSFLALPEDDLSLATALRSPLFGWSEDDLFRLAHGRTERFLWAELRGRSDHAETRDMLQDMRNAADFLRPYELIERLLLRHRGRERLLGRLGPEAADGIDVLLTQALACESRGVPSLTGFLGWLDSSDISVKRQVDQSGGKIRVMSVHGAKGLEAPIVILPDTTARLRSERGPVLHGPDGTALWRASADQASELVGDCLEAERRRADEEDQRLLYVAMTRAENWLIVAGARGKDDPPEDCWYNRVAAGFDASVTGTLDTPFGEGRRIAQAPWPAPAGPATAGAAAPAALPVWVDRPAPPPDRPAPPLSPSDLGGAKTLPGTLESPEALRDGSLIHRLLEQLPPLPANQRDAAAGRILSAAPPATAAALLAQVAAVMSAPHLAALMAPETLREVPVHAYLSALGGRRIGGVIDLLDLSADRVLAVDFKSNSAVPTQEKDVPEGILRQMGAYAAALAQVFPGQRVETAILWTATATLMPLSADNVAAALLRAGASLDGPARPS